MKLLKKNLLLLAAALAFASCQSASEAEGEDSDAEEVIQEEPAPEPEPEEEEEPSYSTFRVKEVSLSGSGLSAMIDGGSGSFRIYALDEREKKIPALSSVDLGKNSYISVLAKGDEFRLFTNAGLKLRTEEGWPAIRGFYKREGLFEAEVSLSLVQKPDSDEFWPGILRMGVRVKNISEDGGEFSAKAVLDTILGENSTRHFYTADGSGITADKVVSLDSGERWILSRGARAAMQVILQGWDTTPPLLVMAGSRGLLGSKWLPSGQGEGSYGFSSILSYNDSAVVVNWNPQFLAPGASSEAVLYLGLCAGTKPLPADKFIDADPALKKEPAPEPEPVPPPKPEPLPPPQPEPQPEAKPEPEESYAPPVGEVEFDTAPNGSSWSVDFDVPIREYQLSHEYIQGLLSRIAELEASQNQADRTEVRRLNAEMDAILRHLGRKK